MKTLTPLSIISEGSSWDNLKDSICLIVFLLPIANPILKPGNPKVFDADLIATKFLNFFVKPIQLFVPIPW